MSQYLKCTLNKNPLTYACGEEMIFSISPKNNCIDASCDYVIWQLMGDDGKKSEGRTSIPLGEPLQLKTTCDRPGFVHLICTVCDENGGPKADWDVLEAGAGAEIEKITYCDEIPEDFDTFWEGVEQMITDFPVEVISKKEITLNVPEGYLCYDVQIATPFGRPASGVLTVPKEEEKFDLLIQFRGYSLSCSEPVYRKNKIVFNVNAHGFENFQKLFWLQEKYKSMWLYGFDKEENRSPETTYWYGMIVRDLMAVKYAKTLPQWNGKLLTVNGGSQGAFQSINVAAHDKDVTNAIIGIPWFCNLNGENCGYMAGWRPEYAEGLRYFDTAAQATRVTCPVTITAYLGDYCCPPSTIMTLYNNLSCIKALDFIQGGTHGYRPPEIEKFELRDDPTLESQEILPGTYRHFKGNKYRVISVARDSENLKDTVIYQALYGKQELWIRPAYMWNEWVEYQGKMVRRFTKTEEE